jgi:colicin import membrane protein
LKDQVRQMQADKAVLQAKLKEALAVQPAALDPRELARAEEKIRGLQKENDLLKVTLAEEKAKPQPAANTKALDETRQALAEANRKLEEQTKTANTVALEKEALQTRLKAVNAEAEAAAALRAENQLLKKQAADLKAAPPPTAKAEEASRQVAQAQAQIAALQSDKEMLRLDKIALENRVKQLSAPAAAQTGAGARYSAEATRRRQQGTL